ncbi:hypothetical protein L1887_33223 [Cichorium endivia]|nr:hypothetical protein L1887_33223 [Cichorium endivia]
MVECHMQQLIDTYLADKKIQCLAESTERMHGLVKVIEDITVDRLSCLSVEFWRDSKRAPNMMLKFIYTYENMRQRSNEIGSLLKAYLESEAYLKSEATEEEDPKLEFMECLGTWLHSTLQRFLDSQGELFPKLLAILFVLVNNSLEIKDSFQKMVDKHFEWEIEFEESWRSQFVMLSMINEEGVGMESLVRKTEVGRIEEGSGRYEFDTTEFGKIEKLSGFMKKVDKIISELMPTAEVAKRVPSKPTVGQWLNTLKKIEEEAREYLEQEYMGSDATDEFGDTFTSLKDAI